ncbi:MAG: hypothetical protein A3F67_05050 [Verrucomicrobia bacterium RIFCSPHIGHO2_12_FULL_41_10]|nr:MAG: hypothetical protein A3F67_05050 [Verrucomicrobia bacterium RIFCSPHIGHO2_12_FULL_41_10]HLB33469.1 hypothetical protein [Chthoniobacterales bacterium]
MKKVILSFLLTTSASSIPLLAQDHHQVNLQSSSSHLGIRPQLMMNPSTLEEGAQVGGEALGIFTPAQARKAAQEREAAAKASSTAQLGVSISKNNEENNAAVIPDLESEDTEPMNSQVSKYLKKEIINNIYEECLAEVANLSLGASTGRVVGENTSKEAAEWAAAAQAADFSKGKAERVFEKAVRDIEEAKSMLDEAKRNVRELEKASQPSSATEQAVAAANLAYEKACAVYATSDYKAKKLAGELAEARVETASAVLHAITVRKSTQHATAAEAELNVAKEAEAEALEAAEVAKSDVVAKAALLSRAEAHLTAAKQAVQGMSGSNGNTAPAVSPMTAAQRVAMKEIEQDKAAAEEVRAKAKKVEITANSAKAKVHEMNFEKELMAYRQAEEAWGETVEGYKNALVHAQEAGLDEEELALSVANAEVREASWRADACWVKARQADQVVATPQGGSLDQLKGAEVAWVHAVEEYKKAIAKAMEAHASPKCIEELTASLNNAVALKSELELRLEAKVHEAQRIVTEKKGAVEAVFARARTAKSEIVWNEAQEAAKGFSAYWNGVIKETKAGGAPRSFEQEEATKQRDQWILKANVAEVKELAVRPCGNRWGDKKDKANVLMTIIRNKIWPTASQAMKEFIDQPTEARLLAAREAAIVASTAYAYAYATASATITACSSVGAFDYASVTAHAIATATETAAAAATVSTTAAEAEEGAVALEASVEASKNAAALAKVGATRELAGASPAAALVRKQGIAIEQESIDWSVGATHEVAKFARAVVAFKREQEVQAGKPVKGWEKSVQIAEVEALAARPCGNGWKEKSDRAHEIIAVIRNKVWPIAWQAMQEFINHPSMDRMVAAREAAYALATTTTHAAATATTYASLSSSGYATLYASLYATATTAAITSATATAFASTAEAVEAAEAAEIFIEASKSAAVLSKQHGVNVIIQENIDWSVEVTQKVAEFTRAVAIFKGASLNKLPDVSNSSANCKQTVDLPDSSGFVKGSYAWYKAQEKKK